MTAHHRSAAPGVTAGGRRPAGPRSRSCRGPLDREGLRASGKDVAEYVHILRRLGHRRTTPAMPELEDSPPLRLGQFQIVGTLGQGGLGLSTWPRPDAGPRGRPRGAAARGPDHTGRPAPVPPRGPGSGRTRPSQHHRSTRSRGIRAGLLHRLSLLPRGPHCRAGSRHGQSRLLLDSQRGCWPR